MNVQEIFSSIADRLSTTTSVNAVYGESRVVGRKTIIPIASVGMGFGAGGGEGKGQPDGDKPCCEGSGGGGGGGGMSRPLGILEVTDEETKFIPIIDTTRVILASLALGGALVLTIGRIFGRRKRQ